MSKKWEISKVSTPERIFKKIAKKMPQPVGIMLFGADCDFKNEVVAELQAGLCDAKIFHGAPSTHGMAKLLHNCKVSLFVLSSMESIDYELRHECVQMMRKISAKTVIGIYTKPRIKSLPSHYGPPAEAEMNRQYTRTIRALDNNPPTADGLDYFIVVEE